MVTNFLSDSQPPIYKDLTSIYDPSIVEAQRQRYARLGKLFESRFGKQPDFYARSPGRVNLIGEHIDYAGYSVLPMAINRDVVIAVAAHSDKEKEIVITNVLDSKYPQRSFTHSKETFVDIDSSIHEWSNYFKCGYKGVCEELNLRNEATGFYAMVDGVVPSGAGLSSSSAFVCCAALATLTVNQREMSKGQLTQVCIKGERYAGVQTGGMDQSISIMAPLGSPLLIHFYPNLQAESVSFAADGYVFVIANTLVTADKHVTAPTNYNLRVVETRLAAALLAKKLGLKVPSHSVMTLREVHGAFLPGKNMIDALETLLESVEQHLLKTLYSREQVAELLNMSVSEMESLYIGKIVIRADGFELYKRAKHVFSEAKRVFEFYKTASDSDSKHLLKDLGTLMNASQASCKDLFNCSCPEIDELTELARQHGAYGSRLTGAGWGGCTVSLISANGVNEFIENMKRDYYYKKFPKLVYSDSMDDFIFASKANVGCAVLNVM